jgi:uncharacterized damage-inducible protein DinB
MTNQDIQLLYAYDRWANARVLQACSALTDQQFTRDLHGSFPSVRNTLVHMLGGMWIWLAYWNDPPRDAASVTELQKRRDALFPPGAFSDLAVLRRKWAEVEKELSEFVDQTTDVTLAERLPFRSTQVSLLHLMQHLANHSSYHRGQVSLMLRQLGAQPLATDFHLFLVEGSDPLTRPG